MVREGVPAVRGVRPERNKVARAHAVSPLVESGRVFLPGAPNAGGTGFDPGRTPQWVQEFVEEFTSFPHVTHDDQVDAMTQALLHLKPRGKRPRVRRLR